MNESEEEELLFFETFSHDNSEVSVYFEQGGDRNVNLLQAAACSKMHYEDRGRRPINTRWLS